MKKMFAYCSGLALCAMLAASTVGNAPSTNVDKNAPYKLTDVAMSQRLTSDWHSRNSSLKDQSVAWFNTNDGYIGTYTVDSLDFMSRYDAKGEYIETMNRKEWDETIPMDIKSSFDNSMYKSQHVTSYWEISDPFRKGYYMELKDDQNKVTRVWADDKGKFSTTPYPGKPLK